MSDVNNQCSFNDINIISYDPGNFKGIFETVHEIGHA